MMPLHPSDKCNCIDCTLDRAEKCYKSGGHRLDPSDRRCFKCGVRF